MKQGEKTKRYILEQSNTLFYKNGYAHTSFTDIMHATGLSKGNITYHFKNKRAILEGIIAQRMEEIAVLFEEWESKTKEPIKRLDFFCNMIIKQEENIASFGCPMGTLTAEFSKNEPELYILTIPMFTAYRRWLSKQFKELNFEASDEKAMSFLSRVQGVAMVAHAFQDKEFLHHEMQKVKSELKEIAR